MSFILNLLRKPEKLTLPERVIHWIRQAPTFALLDSDDEAVAIAHSLDGIIQGREHLQAHILLLRDRIAQDERRVIELEALLSQTSAHILQAREPETDTNSGGGTSAGGAQGNSSSTRSAITEAARETYRNPTVDTILGSATTNSKTADTRRKIRLEDLGNELTRAARQA